MTVRIWCSFCKRDLREGETCSCRDVRSQLEKATALAVQLAAAEQRALEQRHMRRAAALVRRLLS
ncbi:MAG: hypothetical protein K8H88_27945 [Sandaracinaceae bacterium]|nr:hypothetical protein [Sandaracinaceae bacterium]